MVSFLLNNQKVCYEADDPNITVLAFLREQEKKTGTKEGCASGDCGACTVVVAELNDSEDDLHYRTINSCIALMSSLHGKQLITVEDISQGNKLHRVQQAFVDNHGSQCGFCTPGFVMSSFALYHNAAKQPDRNGVLQALSGNLCRCTGYRPIIDAALEACADKSPDQFDDAKQDTMIALKNLHTATLQHNSLLAMPSTRKALAEAIAKYPDAPLVAGSTDLALEITQKLKQYPALISLSQMKELKHVEESDTHITLGAGLSLTDVMPTLLKHFPSLTEVMVRFASLPIRNQATLGGNIANASPIGDTPPVMLALNAEFVADNGKTKRTIPAREFFKGYRQTALDKNEWLALIRIPKLSDNQVLAAYKISKRIEDDISAVCAVFNLTLKDGTVESLRCGFGGVAATPVTCETLINAIIGKKWQTADTLTEGKRILADAFSPIDDVRASAAYRNQALGNLWHRFWLENQPDNHISTRVSHHA